MGYSTDFFGSIHSDKPFDKNHLEYLKAFTSIRHMRRDNEKLKNMPDPLREKVGLPLGIEGEYYVGSASDGNTGQSQDDSITDYNSSWVCPGLWCGWEFTNYMIEWDGGEKFYDYSLWLEYLMNHFMKPWGYNLNGEIGWKGEDFDDLGIITVVDNIISVKFGRVIYDQ